MEQSVTQPNVGRACVILAHGSRNNAAIQAHFDLCDAVAGAVHDVLVLPAFLELADPTLEDAVAAAVASGVTEVSIFPHFLGPGNHVLIDLPKRVATLSETFPGVAVTQLEYLGADPGLRDLVITRITTGL